ncbi:MAG: T9SS type A sorting domain-containing protein [Fibrobacterota bacterium]
MNLSVKMLLYVSCAVFLVSSQPVVDEVIGIMQQDALIRIKGSEFGSRGPRVVLFDDFENGADGQDIYTGEGSARYGAWNATAGNPSYSSESSVSGSLAFRADMSDGYRKYAEALLPDGGDTDLFVSWWIYLPEQDNYPGEGTADGINWKQLWVQGSSTVDDDLVLPVLVGNTVFLDGNDDCLGPAPTGSMHGTLERQWSFEKGEWLRLWAWVRGRADESGQIYVHELGADGIETLTARPATQVQCNEGDMFEKVRINGYGRTTPDCHPMFDDVYIASGEDARARIEIGDHPVYEQCTRLTVALPVQWSENDIEARIQMGTFNENELAYVFVIDKDGNVSGGVPLRQGDGLLRSVSDDADVVVEKPLSYSLDLSQNPSAEVQLQYAPSWINLENGTISGTAPSEPQNDSVVLDISSEQQQEIFTLRLRVCKPLDSLILDNADSAVSASAGWISSRHFSGYYGDDYLYTQSNSEEWFEWEVSDTRIDGTYEVFACWTEAQGRPTDVSYRIECDSGIITVDSIDQSQRGAQWNYLGSFCFSGSAKIRLHSGTNGNEGSCADAIRLVKKAAPVQDLNPVAVVFEEKEHLGSFSSLSVDIRGTVLEYSLPTAGKVDLSVFDMMGKRISVLNGKRMGAGIHRIDLKQALRSRGLANQMYLVRLRHNGNVFSRRIRIQ